MERWFLHWQYGGLFLKVSQDVNGHLKDVIPSRKGYEESLISGELIEILLCLLSALSLSMVEIVKSKIYSHSDDRIYARPLFKGYKLSRLILKCMRMCVTMRNESVSVNDIEAINNRYVIFVKSPHDVSNIFIRTPPYFYTIVYNMSGFINSLTPWARHQFRRVTISHGPLARYVKIAGAQSPGMPGTFSPLPRVSDPDMHHGTCVTRVPWCMPGSLTSGFLWSRRRKETFPAFPAHAQPVTLRIW